MIKLKILLTLVLIGFLTGCYESEQDHDVAYCVNQAEVVVQDSECDAAVESGSPFPFWIFFPHTQPYLNIGDRVPSGGSRGARSGKPSARASTRPSARPASRSVPVRPVPIRPALVRPIVVPRGR